MHGLLKALTGWLMACLALLPGSLPAAETDWKLITDRRDIKVYIGADPDARLKTFRGVTTMALPDEYAMLALYNDIDAFPRWLHMIDEAQLLDERSPLDRDLRFTIKLPWPLSDREVVLNSTLVQVNEIGNESVTAILEGDTELAPPVDGFVRLPEFHGTFKFRRLAPGKVEAIFEVSSDLGGYLPQWIVNFALSDIPYFSLEKMRRIVTQQKYQNHYYPYLDLFGPGRPADAPPVTSWVYGTGLNQAPATDSDGSQ